MQFAGLSLPMIEQFVALSLPCLRTSQNVCISSNQVESKSHKEYVFEEKVNKNDEMVVAVSPFPRLLPAHYPTWSLLLTRMCPLLPNNQQTNNRLIINQSTNKTANNGQLTNSNIRLIFNWSITIVEKVIFGLDVFNCVFVLDSRRFSAFFLFALLARYLSVCYCI